MLSSFVSTRAFGRASTLALSTLALVALAACGGGGGGSSGGGAPTATVSSVSVTATKYGSQALVTINGTGLDSTLAVSSPTCATMTMLTAAPTASSSTTAYYSCTVDGATTGTVTAKSNGTAVGSGTFSVPLPVVTMTVDNGQGVNGNILITLTPDKTPITVDNFLNYVHAGFYNGLIFHRVSPANNVIQGGGYGPSTGTSLPTPKTTFAPIALETGGGSNVQWSIGMANTGQPNSATSQFYINTAANPLFDGSYAVFGAITTASIPVAQSIVAAQCDASPDLPTGDCLPLPNVVITSATQTQ